MNKKKVFIISLKRCQERRQLMLEQTNGLGRDGVEFIFFDAVDAKNAEHMSFAKHFSHIFGRMYKGRILKDGEKACFASHYSLWQKCLELGEPIFVLEDDVIIKENFCQAAEDIASSSYDLVRLFMLFKPREYPIGMHYSLAFEKVGGTQGYYITPRGAEMLLRRSALWFCPVDDYMDMLYYTKLPNIIYRPFALENSKITTTIAAVRSTHSGLFWKYFREVFRIFRFVYKNIYLLANKKRLLRKLAYSKKL